MLPDDQPNPPDEDEDDDEPWCWSRPANLEEGSNEELDYLAAMEKKGYFQ